MHPDVTIQIDGLKGREWVYLAILAKRQGTNVLTYQDKKPCASKLLAIALVTEKVLQLAAQYNWQLIEINTGSTTLLQALRQGNNAEVVYL